MGKFYIAPSGHCSVFLRRRVEAQQLADLGAEEVHTNADGGSSGSERRAGRQKSEAAAYLHPVGKTGVKDRRQAAGNVLEPLLLQKHAKRRAMSKLPKKLVEGLEPWELAELKYLKDLQLSTLSPNFSAKLLDRYLQPRARRLPAVVAEAEESLSRLEDQEQPEASAELQCSAPRPAKLTVLEAAMAMPMPLLEPQRQKTQQTLKTPDAHRSCRGGSPSSSSSKVAAALTLPGMNAVLPGGVNWSNWSNKPGSGKGGSSQQQTMSGREPEWYGCSDSKHMLPPGPAQPVRVLGWGSLCPFIKFLKKPIDAQGFRDDEREERGDHARCYAFDHQSQDQSSIEVHAKVHAKTAGMVGSIQSWLNSGTGQKGRDGGGLRPGATAETEHDKAESRMLVILAKRYALPVNEVRDIKHEFNEYDSKGEGHITKEEFRGIIRKRTNLPELDDIPSHLLKGISEVHERIGFEEFLKWSMLTSWSEEMMMPCKKERNIRQLAREEDMMLLDVEKVKRLFDEFDTDGSGEIEEEEFRHILYKMLHLIDGSTDVPLKRLQRYWREVDLDGSKSIGFSEFLIWYKTSFNKDGGIDGI